MQKHDISGPTLYFSMCWPALAIASITFFISIPFFPIPHDFIGRTFTLWTFGVASSYTLYNTMSYTVLAMVSNPLSHALLSTLKRAFVVVSLSIVYATAMPLLFALGSFIALLGGFAYMQVTQRLPKALPTPITPTFQRCLLVIAVGIFVSVFVLTIHNSSVAAQPRCARILESTSIRQGEGILSKDFLAFSQTSVDITLKGSDKRNFKPKVPSFSCRQQLLPWFAWNGRVGMWRTGNFGDDINRDIAALLLNISSESVKMVHQKSAPSPRLIGAGSVLSFVTAGDVVWGSGCHEKSLEKVHWAALSQAEVYAIRGPLVCAIMKEHNVSSCGGTFGDPGLLGVLYIYVVN